MTLVLPSSLVIARASRGRIRPIFLSPDERATSLVERIVGILEANVGRRRWELREALRRLEEGEGGEPLDFDYRSIRGVAALLEEGCRFTVDAAMRVDAGRARAILFEEAAQGFRRYGTMGLSPAARDEVLATSAAKLGMDPTALEENIYSDLDDELVLGWFSRPPGGPSSLVRRYNLALTLALLSGSLGLDLSVGGDWRALLSKVKSLGMMFEVSAPRGDHGAVEDATGAPVSISIEGPESTSKMRRRYASLLSSLMQTVLTSSEPWSVTADVRGQRTRKTYSFELRSEYARSLLPTEFEVEGEEAPWAQTVRDEVASRLVRSFEESSALVPGWTVRREYTALVSGDSIVLPDFCFENRGIGRRVYLELVGFWTEDYLERRMRNLQASMRRPNYILAAESRLACTRSRAQRDDIVHYSKSIRIGQIVERLRLVEREAGDPSWTSANDDDPPH